MDLHNLYSYHYSGNFTSDAVIISYGDNLQNYEFVTFKTVVLLAKVQWLGMIGCGKTKWTLLDPVYSKLNEYSWL